MNSSSVLVKVGNKSTSRFRNVKVYRAITIHEMQDLIEKESISILVIECIRDSEYSRASEFIKSYLENGDNKVFFFTPDNDETTTGLADELSSDIYLNLHDLHEAINRVCGINVDNDLNTNGIKIDDSSSTGFSDDFGSLLNADDIFGVEEYKETEKITLVGKRSLDNSAVTKEELGIEEEPENIAVSLDKDENASDATTETENTPVEDSESIKELKAQVEDQSGEITILRKRLDEANSRANNLSKVIKSIKDERNMYMAELSKFESADVIVDPAVVSEFNRLKENISVLEEKLELSGSHSDTEYNNLASRISELEQANIDYEGKVSELSLTKASLEKQLQEALDSTAMDEEIKELNSRIEELETELREVKYSLSSTETELDRSKADVASLNANIADITSDYLDLLSILKAAVVKFKEVNRLERLVDDLTNQTNKLQDDYNRISAELRDSNATLERVRAETETRVELARNFAKEDLEQTKRDNVSLRAQLSMVSSQLTAKETQYNSLAQMTGIDESGAQSVLESNKILEATLTTLRTQLAEMKKSYEQSEKNNADLSRSVYSLTTEKDKLVTQLKAMSSNYSGGAGIGVIPPFDYNGRAQIICVTGSGSYGVTTTAFSLALSLASNSRRVIFVDFDLLAAKADGWFGKSPLINGVPGCSPNNPVSSGLGIAIDRGVPLMISYANMCIQSGPQLKSGTLDYLSGLYTRPDVVKLMSCDYSGLMNYLGNSYDYVIMDFGRLGASDINNQILKNFSDIARSTVMITLSDKLEIRNGRIELQKAKLNINKVAWLLNMAETTKIDDTSRSRISPATYAVLPFVDDFYGKKMDFSKNRVTRDKFKQFIDTCVLHR